MEEVEVAPPKKGEVRIKMINTALCHTYVFSTPILLFSLSFY